MTAIKPTEDEVSNLTGSNTNIHDYQELVQHNDEEDEEDYQQQIEAPTEEFPEENQLEDTLQIEEEEENQISTEEIVDQAILGASMEISQSNYYEENSNSYQPLVDSTSNISDDFTIAPEDKEIAASLYEASCSSVAGGSESNVHF